MKQLDRRRPAQHRVACPIDDAHAAFAQLLLQRVLAQLARLARLAPEPIDHVGGPGGQQHGHQPRERHGDAAAGGELLHAGEAERRGHHREQCRLDAQEPHVGADSERQPHHQPQQECSQRRAGHVDGPAEDDEGQHEEDEQVRSADQRDRPGHRLVGQAAGAKAHSLDGLHETEGAPTAAAEQPHCSRGRRPGKVELEVRLTDVGEAAAPVLDQPEDQERRAQAGSDQAKQGHAPLVERQGLTRGVRRGAPARATRKVACHSIHGSRRILAATRRRRSDSCAPKPNRRLPPLG